jgi:hypothetical protein
MHISIDKLIELVKSLTSAQFFGKLVISIEHGRITSIKKEETLKATDLI